ncbi:MAG: TatD family hydrolase [Dehalococcoidia bacterium]
MLIDTHIHLSYPSPEERERNLQAAKKVGAEAFIAVSENAENSRRVVEAAESTDGLYCGVGVHPRQLHTYSPEDLDVFRELIKKSKKMVCIGECGLDYEGPLFGPHLTPEEREQQRQLFRDMIRLGREFGLPLNMHSDRPSFRDLLGILREEKAYEIGGMMHNFQGSVDAAHEYLDMGFYISASVTIHHPLADRLRSVFTEISIGQMLLDSDSPDYKLPRVGESQEPYPYDLDKVSEPRMVKYIAEKLAELKGMPVEEVEAITSLNARRLFSLPGRE